MKKRGVTVDKWKRSTFMKTSNKMAAIVLLISLPVISTLGQDKNKVSFTTSELPKSQLEKRDAPSSQISAVKDASGTEDFSIVEYFRSNPEDFSVKYQAYMRSRLALDGDSIQEKLDAEILKVKNELKNNQTDYTKMVYKESPAPVTKEQDQITASTAVSPNNSKAQKL